MLNYAFTLEISEEQRETRLDLLILGELRILHPQLSRATIKNCFREKRVNLRSQTIDPATVLPPGRYEITLMNWDPSVMPTAIPSMRGCFLPIIYEDNLRLVLAKIPGVPSVPLSSTESETAVGAALAHFPELAMIGRGGLEPGILHRLDTGTSGVLVFAKTQPEYDRLRLLWKMRQVGKIYRAISAPTQTNLEPDLGDLVPLKIDFPLAHDPHSNKRMMAIKPQSSRIMRGNPIAAITWVNKCLKIPKTKIAENLLRNIDKQLDKQLYDLEIRIETGVMHQIRCHLSTINWPILGDEIYGKTPSSRLWLHAWKLEIPLPDNKTSLLFEAPLPKDWPI